MSALSTITSLIIAIIISTTLAACLGMAADAGASPADYAALDAARGPACVNLIF